MQVHALHHQEIGLKIQDISYKNPYNVNEIHRHSYYEIFLFENGFGGSQMIDFDEFSVKEKSLYIVCPNQVHLLQKKKNETGLVLQFTQAFFNEQFANTSIETLFSLKTNPETLLSKTDFETLQFSFNQLFILEKSKEAFRAEKLKSFFTFTIFQILSILKTSKSAKEKENLTLDFLFLTEMNFMTDRKVSNYAERLNVSVSKLNTTIKKDLGKTPAAILNDLVVVEIKRLVVLGKMSHKEISYQLNFDSPSSYNRFVKRNMDCKPSEIGQKIKKHNS